MSWESEFDDLLTQEVTRQEFTGQDVHAQPTHGTASTVKCRVVYKPQVVKTQGTGEAADTIREVVSTATVYCSGHVGWDPQDKITLPDGATPPILEVRKYPDEDGDHHEMVLV